MRFGFLFVDVVQVSWKKDRFWSGSTAGVSGKCQERKQFYSNLNQKLLQCRLIYHGGDLRWKPETTYGEICVLKTSVSQGVVLQ